jgi:hypothetical protein
VDVPGQLLFSLHFNDAVASINVPRGRRRDLPGSMRTNIRWLDGVLSGLHVRSLSRVHTPFPEWRMRHKRWGRRQRIMDSTFLLHFDPDRTFMQEALELLTSQKGVYHVEPNRYCLPLEVRTGPPAWTAGTRRPESWVGLDEGSSAIRIAVIDTGINQRHAEFEGGSTLQVLPGCDVVDCTGVQPPFGCSWAGDYTTRDDRPDDDHGHGTHVASLIAGRTCGLAPGCTLMPIRAIATATCEGTLSSAAKIDDVARALCLATASGAHIINMSYGNISPGRLGYQSVEAQAVKHAIEHGCFLVAAMGNEGATGAPKYPATYPGVCGVGAIDNDDNHCSFSQGGHSCDLCAPGDDLSGAALEGGYATMSGTSQAAAVVSAAAGLVLSAFVKQQKPSLPNGKGLGELLTGTARKLPLPRGLGGYGCVDVASAIKEAVG